MFKKLLSITLTVFTVFLIGSNLKSISAEASAQSSIAVELSTGKVLFENNSNVKLPMASTTKIMTAIIIIEDCNLNDVITVPDEAIGVEGSSIYLKRQEQISIKDLLYGLMLRSGNDSATALAIYHSGSVAKFAEAMNERAKAIGTENTNFTNPSGLPDENHFTTANDLCKIACYAMKNVAFKEIVGTVNYNGEYRSFVNKNKMLKKYDGANGIKTGYTVRAGRCLVSSANRNGMDVVCVVLNCPDMYEFSSDILDRCFNEYKLVSIDKNKIFMSDNVLCKLDKNVNTVLKCTNNLQLKIKNINSNSKIKIGDYVADLEIYDENNLLFTEKLYSIINR